MNIIIFFTEFCTVGIVDYLIKVALFVFYARATQ
jgi:hypothetical protein